MREKLLQHKRLTVEKLAWLSDSLKEFQPQNIWHKKISECQRNCKIVIRTIDVLLDKEERMTDERVKELIIRSNVNSDKVTILKRELESGFGKG